MSSDGSGHSRSGGRPGGGSRYGDRSGGYGGSGGGYGGSGGSNGRDGSRYGDNRNSQSRGSGGYERDRGGDDRGRGRSSGNGRDGDWRCTDPSCGNVNFARRLECNKCGTPAPSPANSGGNRGGNYDSENVGNGSSKRIDGGTYSKAPPVLPPTYGGSSLPPPTSYTGGPNSYPPSYGGATGHGGDAQSDAPAETPVQCDENCDDSCDNSRIYISNLPPDVTVDELRDLFGGIGQVARIKQKRGFKDQWPWNIKIYTDDSGKNKGDACVVYEDPAAAHSAGNFYNNHDLRGYKINVAMAAKSAPRPPPVNSQRGGGRGGYGGGGDRRREGAASGPDRSYHGGGNRSRPY